jgi:hypothetical protein
MIKTFHNLPDKWLTARAVSWMNSETTGRWWLMSYTANGTPVSASSKGYQPSIERQEFAKNICEYLNLQNNADGAWMAGFVDKDHEQSFYLLWKDCDGDIRIPIEFPQSFIELSTVWKLDDFLGHSAEAIAALKEYEYALDFNKGQRESSLVRGRV